MRKIIYAVLLVIIAGCSNGGGIPPAGPAEIHAPGYADGTEVRVQFYNYELHQTGEWAITTLENHRAKIYLEGHQAEAAIISETYHFDTDREPMIFTARGMIGSGDTVRIDIASSIARDAVRLLLLRGYSVREAIDHTRSEAEELEAVILSEITQPWELAERVVEERVAFRERVSQELF